MTGTTVSVAGFLMLLVAGIVLEIRGRRAGAAATAGQALAAAMRITPGRLAVFSVWIWLGVHFLAR